MMTQEKLTLDVIQALGGSEDDLALLDAVDESSASELEFEPTGHSKSVSRDEVEAFVRGLKMEEHGLVGMKEGTGGKSAKEARSAVGKSSAKERSVEGVEKRKEEGGKGGGGVKTVKEKEKKKEKRKTSTVSTGEEAEGDIRDEHPDTDGGEAAPPTGKDTIKQKDRKTKTKKVKEAKEKVEGKRTAKDTPSREYIGEQLLLIEAEPHKKLLMDLNIADPWTVQAASSEPMFPLSAVVINHLGKVGGELMEAEVRIYEQVREKEKGRSDVQWLRTVLSSGTLSDKMAALTLVIQESPVHTLSYLDSLVSMANKKGKRECVMAVDSLKELWLSCLLPNDRKLKALKQQPLNLLVSTEHPLRTRVKWLLLWYFEDQLKAKYAQYISILDHLSHDTVANIREKVLGHIFDLLYQKPEQEQSLLQLLVNKLGDPVRKVASKCIFFLLKLLNHHINMKVIVAKEIEILIHRPNINPKAQYYGVCCLNQFVINQEDQALAGKLVDIYLTFFKVYVKQRQLDAKVLAAILTGINRAFPFVKGEIPSLEDHLHTLFKVVHVGPVATGIQSLMLLYQIMESKQAVSGRYYQALYTKLLDPALRNLSGQAMFLNVLYKSLKSDPVMNRVKAFLKRILQVCGSHAPSFVCGCLILISEVLKLRPTLWSFILQSESTDLEHFSDVVEETEKLVVCGDVSEDEQSAGGGHGNKEGHQTCSGHGNKEGGESSYIIDHRNPLHCGAESTCLWELERLSNHYHPSVHCFASTIASGESISYHGDPLQDFTLIRFLDRFVYKNPKQKERDHGGSVMQRLSRVYMDTKKEVPANSASFAAMNEANVRNDELFMYRYFKHKADKDTKSRKTQEGEEAEEPTELDEMEESDYNMDFAGQLEREAKAKTQKGKKKARRGSEEEEEEGEEFDGGAGDEDDDEFDYDALGDDDFDDSDDEGGGAKDQATEQEMEKLLLDNMSSEEEGGEEEAEPAKKRRKQRDVEEKEEFEPDTMFASAEEFAHLLETAGTEENSKQLQWEGKQRHGNRGRERGGLRGRGGARGRGGSRGRGGPRTSRGARRGRH
eukprot:Em0019g1225a